MKVRQCAECRDGEHENYDDEVVLVACTAPGVQTYRAYLCLIHRMLREDDGYRVRPCN